MGNQPTHIQSYGTKFLLPIRPGTRAHAFSNSGYIFNQDDAHDAMERMKHLEPSLCCGKPVIRHLYPYRTKPRITKQEKQNKPTKQLRSQNWYCKMFHWLYFFTPYIFSKKSNFRLSTCKVCHGPIQNPFTLTICNFLIDTFINNLESLRNHDKSRDHS